MRKTLIEKKENGSEDLKKKEQGKMGKKPR